MRTAELPGNCPSLPQEGGRAGPVLSRFCWWVWVGSLSSSHLVKGVQVAPAQGTPAAGAVGQGWHSHPLAPVSSEQTPLPSGRGPRRKGRVQAPTAPSCLIPADTRPQPGPRPSMWLGRVQTSAFPVPLTEACLVGLHLGLRPKGASGGGQACSAPPVCGRGELRLLGLSSPSSTQWGPYPPLGAAVKIRVCVTHLMGGIQSCAPFVVRPRKREEGPRAPCCYQGNWPLPHHPRALSY